MSHLSDIPIAVVNGGANREAPNGRALLGELESLLEDLVHHGREGSIDLRSLPLSPWDLDFLREQLGQGEVEVEVNALGPSRIYETAIHGIWWVQHLNSDNEVMAEFLEITHCPDIIRAHPADVRDSIEVLRSKVLESSQR